MEELKITRERAIKRMEWILKHEIYCSDKLSHAAINMAITALRSSEPENKPLTLEQLKQMEGEQVWIPETEAYFSGHGIVNVKEEKVYASDEENDYYPFDEYGAWLAYAHKPEGSENK